MRHYGNFNNRIALEILRDNKGKGDKELGLGNRNAIDAGICAHSVIANVTRGELWVSDAPHTYGHYVYVPVSRMLAVGPENAFRMAHPEEFNLARHAHVGANGDLQEFRRSARAARTAIDDGELGTAENAIRTCLNVNPDSFETAYLQGLLNYEGEKYAEAAKDFQRALDREPHYEEVRRHIREMIERAKRRSE
jgi:hypothetical protein